MIKKSKLLSQFPNIIHGFTSKSFGIIRDVSDSMPTEVYENRKNLAKAIGVDFSKMMIAFQVHGNDIIQVNAGEQGTVDKQHAQLPKADGFITNIPEYTLIVGSSDCVPVLLYDQQNKVISAVHAGWRGTVKEITKKAIDTMQTEYGSSRDDIIAVIGPSICGKCYDNSTVEDDRLEQFERLYPENQGVVLRENEQIFLDIARANEIQLRESGLKQEQIERIPVCTFEDNQWPSYRRNPQELAYSIWSFISLKA